MAKDRLQKKARDIIAEECQGRVLRRFPSQWLDRPLAEILDAARRGDRDANTAWKLLNDARFKKP